MKGLRATKIDEKESLKGSEPREKLPVNCFLCKLQVSLNFPNNSITDRQIQTKYEQFLRWKCENLGK